MKNTDLIKRNMLNAILKAVNKEAEALVRIAENDYGQLRSDLGNAETGTNIVQLANDLILLTLFGKGQRALIGEYGSGSEMDLDNPAMKDYVNGDIFNKERLKHNMAIITRVNDPFYKDLDENVIVRRQPKNEVNLEEKGSNRYDPVKPKYILLKAIEQRLDSIVAAVAEAIATESAIEKLFDGLKFRVKL